MKNFRLLPNALVLIGPYLSVSQFAILLFGLFVFLLLCLFVSNSAARLLVGALGAPRAPESLGPPKDQFIV